MQKQQEITMFEQLLTKVITELKNKMLCREADYIAKTFPKFVGSVYVKDIEFGDKAIHYTIILSYTGTRRYERLRCTTTLSELKCNEITRQELFHMSLSQ